MLNQDFEELANVTLGTPRSDLLGGGRNEDGLVHDMKAVKRDMHLLLKANGNGKALGPGKTILLWAAAIGGVASVASAWIIANAPVGLVP